MIPRGTPDISWNDLFFGLRASCSRGDPQQVQAHVEARWSPGDSLACLSVRSGFDLVLQVLALPPGSEILVSAITIPDMLRIIEHHGLVAVPVDIDPNTLAVDRQLLEQAIGPQTRAVLVAHLFGSRMPLDRVVAVARQHGLLVFEDCAQAYDASGYRGHPGSDLSMFSFGPIKTATALGGALLRFRTPELLAQVRARQADYPRQPRREFCKRVLRFMLLKILSTPALFQLLVLACQVRGTDHDTLIAHALRGFAGVDLFERIRRQPSLPLLRLLDRRIARPPAHQIAQRSRLAAQVDAALASQERPGVLAAHHTHWVIPVQSDQPDTLVRLLWAQGFDATRRGSSLVAVPAPRGRREPHAAQSLVARLVYLPVLTTISDEQAMGMARIVGEHRIHAKHTAYMLRR